MKKYAIALYDNEAESEDELNFKKNEFFQVMQIDYEGMEGWWLCKSLKTNLVGLAAGNRLKLVTDEKILHKLINNNINNEKLSASSSSVSILSSNSSASSVKSIENDLQQINLNHSTSSNNNNATIKTPKKVILPPKNNETVIKKQLSQSLSNEEDDYDYDIPENNQPTNQLIKQKSSSNDSDKEETRKSTSPTIDSGISTCSLVSCNSDISIKSAKHLSSDEELTNLQSKFINLTNKLQHLCGQISPNDLSNLKQNSLNLKSILYEYISDVLKRCKQEHACFHFDLSVFNKFKTVYRQLKEFYLYYEAILTKLNNLYNWNNEILLKEPTDLNELVTKLAYLNGLLDSLKQLVDKNNFFDYHSQTATSKFNNKKGDEVVGEASTNDENNYEYEYDNNTCPVKSNDYDDVYESIYESNYCQIDDDITTGNTNQTTNKSTNLTNCLTLKKNEEVIKREIRIATTNSSQNETSRINMVDQMLLKFYLKHIEDNLGELKSTYDCLLEQFKETDYEPSISSHDLEHKLAIYGHKLVFICDTLQRNLNNLHLKSNLSESSNCLSDSLKVYMIRVRSRQQQLDSNNNKNHSSKQSEHFVESLNNVLNASNQFKQLIIKYYLKSY